MTNEPTFHELMGLLPGDNFDSRFPKHSLTRQQENWEYLEPELDPGIRYAVKVLIAKGIETTQSCEGGPGHPFPEPTICFNGQQGEGFRALAIAMAHGLPVWELRRMWRITDGEPVGPEWRLTFVS